MRDSLIEAIRGVEADDAPRFSNLVYVDPAGVVDALVAWLRQNASDIEIAADPAVPTSLLREDVSALADLLEEIT